MNKMKKILSLIMFLCLLGITFSAGLRSPNGPEGLPDEDDGIQVYDDDEELNEEDVLDLDAEDDDSLPPIGDTTLPPQEAKVVDDDDEEVVSFDQLGELLEDPSFLSQLLEQIKAAFVTKNEPIISKPGEEAECYSLEDVKCEFVAEELPVMFLVEYDDEPEEYTLTVERDAPETEVMRRRLKADTCGSFGEVFKLFNREINCELKEYAHRISIKHIG